MMRLLQLGLSSMKHCSGTLLICQGLIDSQDRGYMFIKKGNSQVLTVKLCYVLYVQ